MKDATCQTDNPSHVHLHSCQGLLMICTEQLTAQSSHEKANQCIKSPSKSHFDYPDTLTCSVQRQGMHG